MSQVMKKASVAFVSIDYNQFEAAFLICSVRVVADKNQQVLWLGVPSVLDSVVLYVRFFRQVLILLSGMVFVSKGFPLGSPGYKVITALVAMVVLISIAGFIAFVGFEVSQLGPSLPLDS